MTKPFTPQADMLGNLPDRIIASIFEYVQNGDRDDLVLPFITKLEEAEGVEDGLTEDEFFFLLDLYEGDGNQLLSDCLIIEQGVMNKPVPGRKRGQTYEPATSPFSTQREGYKMELTEPPEIQKAVNALDSTLRKKADQDAKELGDAFKEFHQNDLWYKAMEKLAGKMDVQSGAGALIRDHERKEKRALDRISMKERRHLVKVNRLVRQLNLARTGRDVRALKKQISIEKKKMDADREVQYRLFMSQRKTALETIREVYPGFWRGMLFGREGTLKPDYGIGLLRRIGRMVKGAVVGWETDVDKFRAEKLVRGRKITDVEAKKYGWKEDKRVAQRRVPGAIQWTFGQRELKGGQEYGPNEPLEGIRAHEKVERYMSRGGLPGATWRGTGFTLFGKRFYTGADAGLEAGKRKIPIPEIMHPWAERGVVGPEAKRAMKIFMKDIKAVDAEIWKLQKDIKHMSLEKPEKAGERPFKDTEQYYAMVSRVKQLRKLRKNILRNKNQFVKYAKAAKSISSKLRKGKLNIGDIAQTMKPLVPVLAAALVAAGVVWFKARHSREMLRQATNKVLKEATRRGMYLSSADVRKTVNEIVKNPMKIRKITHAIELAKAGVAVERAANLLAEIVIIDLGINKMPMGSHGDFSMEPTTSGQHTGQLSAPRSLEPFSF